MITAVLALVLLPATPMAVQASMMAEPVQGATINDRKAPNGSGSLDGADDLFGMVYVPAGEVTIGTPSDQVELLGQNDEFKMKEIAAETPQRRISVDSFYIDRTEVTNLQWKVFLEATGRQPSEVLVEFNWPGGEIPAGQEQFPIGNVNFPEIQEYLKWAGRRLPAEEEWVRAARGDDERTYPWGDRWERRKVQSGMTVPQQPTPKATKKSTKSVGGQYSTRTS